MTSAAGDRVGWQLLDLARLAAVKTFSSTYTRQQFRIITISVIVVVVKKTYIIRRQCYKSWYNKHLNILQNRLNRIKVLFQWEQITTESAVGVLWIDIFWLSGDILRGRYLRGRWFFYGLISHFQNVYEMGSRNLQTFVLVAAAALLVLHYGE